MQWVGQTTGQAGNRAAHLVHSGAVDHLVVMEGRIRKTTKSNSEERMRFVAGFSLVSFDIRYS